MTDTAATEVETLGSRIRQARKDAGYRNTESFAVRLGVGQRTVQRWETGASEPSISRLREIAALTGRSLAYFISGDTEPEEEAA